MQLWRVLILVCLLFFSGCDVKSDLSLEEKNYIDTHTILWAASDNYYPFIFIDKNDEPKGMSVDYMRIISQKTGLKFRMIGHGQLSTNLDNLKDGNIDLITSLRPTPDRSHYAIFSRPYIVVDLVLIKRVNIPKTVGVGRGYAAIDYLKAARRDLKIVEFSNDENSYKALISGEIDSAIMDVPASTIFARNYHMEFDKTSIPYEYPLSFATSKENVILRSILDKALTSINETEHEGIRAKWM